MIIGGNEVVGGFRNNLPFEFQPNRMSYKDIQMSSEVPYSLNDYLIFNRVFRGFKNKKNNSPGRVLIDPALYSPGRVYVTKQYSIRKPEFAGNQESMETVKSQDNGSGDAYKKSEFRSNPYIMLRP